MASNWLAVSLPGSHKSWHKSRTHGVCSPLHKASGPCHITNYPLALIIVALGTAAVGIQDAGLCGREVGGPLGPPGMSSSTTYAHLILGARFRCNGTVNGWIYRRTRAEDAVFVSVWRHLGDDLENYYQFVGKNRIPPGRPGRRLFTVNPDHQIEVQHGDFIGFHYSVYNTHGIIAVSNRTVNMSLSVSGQETHIAGLYDENFLLNSPINFNTNDRKVVVQQNALVALYKYRTLNDSTNPENDNHQLTVPEYITAHEDKLTGVGFRTPPTKLEVNSATSVADEESGSAGDGDNPPITTLNPQRASAWLNPTSFSSGILTAKDSVAWLLCGGNRTQLETLSCREGTVLLIITALYGRTRVPCDGTTSVVLSSQDIFKPACVTNVWPLVTGRCSQKPRCQLHVTDDVFGQPCAETGTGLHIRYACVPGSGPAIVRKNIEDVLVEATERDISGEIEARGVVPTLVPSTGTVFTLPNDQQWVPPTTRPTWRTISDKTSHMTDMSSIAQQTITTTDALVEEMLDATHGIAHWNSSLLVQPSRSSTTATNRLSLEEPLMGGLVGGALCGGITMVTIAVALGVYLRRQRRLKIQRATGLVQSHIIENKLRNNPLYQSTETLQAIRRFETHPRRSAPKYCAPKPPVKSAAETDDPAAQVENVYLTMNSSPKKMNSHGKSQVPIQKPPRQARRNVREYGSTKPWVAVHSVGNITGKPVSAPYSNMGRQVIYPQYGTGPRATKGDPESNADISQQNTPGKLVIMELTQQDENVYYNIADSDEMPVIRSCEGNGNSGCSSPVKRDSLYDLAPIVIERDGA